MFLGTNLGHGSAVALVNNEGELIFAIEEERLNQIKNTDAYPKLALEIVNKKYGPYFSHFEGWHLWRRMYFKGIVHTIRYINADTSYIKYRFIHEIKRLFRYIKLSQPKFVGHHKSHAYSLLPCGMESDTLIFVSDALGENVCTSLYFWKNNKMIHLASSDYPNSIGSMYHQFAYHVGFRGRQGPGKLMALSGYGSPIWYTILKKYLRITKGKLQFNDYPIWKMREAWMHFANNALDEKNTQELKLKEEILKSKDNYELAIDLAASLQKLFNEVSLTIINQGIDLLEEKGQKTKAIGLVGGAALNCQSNGKIKRFYSSKKINVIVSPWSDDGGTAIGAAYYAYYKSNSKQFNVLKSNPFLSHLPEDYKGFKLKTDQIKGVAKALQQGQIVAISSGRMEFGPRALGGRCIIAKPTIENRDKLNAMKKRPSFMPFAPVVFKKDFKFFFEGEGSEYMAWTVKIKEQYKQDIIGAVHITNEARVQVLNNESTSLLAKIMTHYKAVEGNSVLLLTSLNANREPISFTIMQSEKTSKKLGCDIFISDDRVVKFNQ
ncbi:carbamoyltransferase C-terminal domain-containing protein [Psychroserpens sp. SPM9]|uniref:carbamoyltransferase C-terminal domain-containing protein n=1 Tax=Psychroserpens sp. SPM9 TaxID=2975598 RepID=UPI0021A363C5|nr:carbamoyltransferase C-terminal domain-containing protein [Psychroserpens sp. SPM9]MDG5490613.1 carbamoyltransferase C-terminal domain-containing protein [Psychroserpens sp. SPM9]